MANLLKIIIIFFCISNQQVYSQLNKYSINGLVMLNGESAENLIVKRENLQNLDSLYLYNNDSIYYLHSFRFTATFPGGLSDWISTSNKLTPEMKETIKFMKSGFILFTDFIIKNDRGDIVNPYYKSIYIQIVE